MIGVRIVSATATSEACKDVLVTAVTAGKIHGIGYWAEVEELIEGPLPVLIINDFEMDEPKKQFKLTVVEIADAINKILTDPKGTDAEGWVQQLLHEDYVDGPLADAIVQVACHGKVLYA